jgi:uncharacterized damage-inducible protein DinB
MRYAPNDGFPYYFDLVRNGDCELLFTSRSIFTFLDSIDEKKATYRYAPDKWSIKQIVGHLTDHERIKIFRAFLLSRNEAVALWGYDQNSLVENSRFEELTFQQLKTDLQNVRLASISFVKGLSGEQLKIKGMAGQHEITLGDFLKSVIGHEVHHMNILKERYL